MPMRKDVNERTTVSTIRDAYLRGDFEHCVTLCETYSGRDEHEEIDVQLLKARALLPLNRADSALDILRRLKALNGANDERLIAKMLTGVAYVKLGQNGRGLELLKVTFAEAASAHPTVRADIAANLGIAHYSKREYAEALEALSSVPEEADIVHARALLYMAWVAWGQGDYNTAADRFECTLRRIDACHNYDRYVEAYALYGYGLLCAELPRLHLWKDIQQRINRFDWSVSGLAVPHFWLWIAASYVAEMIGALDESRRLASAAEENAPSIASRIVALCRLAELFGPYGEIAAHAHFVRKARQCYDDLGHEDGLREEHDLPLTLADQVVHARFADQADALLTYYREAHAPRVREHPDEPKLEAHRAAIEGALHELRGDRALALRRYLTAFRRFQDLSFGRSASIVAYRLASLGGDPKYRGYVDTALSDASKTYWVKARMGQPKADVQITAAQADVLKLVAQGMTNKQIAAARGISFFRARNVVGDLLAAFGARNRAELGHMAVAQGLVVACQVESGARVG